MDPVLKLYRGIQVMLTTNVNVCNGLANGMQAMVERIFLKPNQTPISVLIDDEEIPVRAVLASQISKIALRHTNPRINQVYSLFSLNE